MEESNRLPKIDATNIGSLPTTRKDGASYDRPGRSRGVERAYRAAQKKKKKDKTRKLPRKEINMLLTILLVFP